MTVEMLLEDEIIQLGDCITLTGKVRHNSHVSSMSTSDQVDMLELCATRQLLHQHHVPLQDVRQEPGPRRHRRHC